ncbi:MAG TPA: sialidase family protein [Methylomirabilota bacterium]|nr:sialidase family protein [Methylomirabilota bacterium]
MLARKILEEAYPLTRRARRWSTVLGIGTMTAALAWASAAGAAGPSVTLGPLVQITGPSPFNGCTADDPNGQEAEGSVFFANSEIEPFIDVNPAAPDHMIAVWQQDRWSDGGARGDVSAFSEDGGATWETVTPPTFTECSNGTFERASDPWVTFAPNGDAYFESLSFDEDLTIFGGHSAVQVSKSTDGGHSWGPPVNLIEDNDPNVFNDKESMTADPTNAKLAYATWDRLENFSSTEQERKALAAAVRRSHDKIILAGQVLRQMQAAAATANAAPPQFKGPTYFTRTKDAGANWERASIIFDPGANNQTINNQILVDGNGVLTAVFTEILNLANGNVRVNISLKRSTDSGFSFTPVNRAIRATQIFSLAIANPVGTFTPDDNLPVRDAGLLFDPAVDQHNGNLYLVWQDNRFSRRNAVDQIAFAMSTNGGRTWSKPIKINETPFNFNVKREAAFIPTIVVNGNGVLAVTYYDFRNDDATGELTDQFAVFCDPASRDCTKRASWGSEQRLTDTSFDIRDAPTVDAGEFLGDYMGSASVNADVHPAFGIADGAEETSIYTRDISIAPAVASAAR